MLIRDGDWTLFDHDLATGRSVWHMNDAQGKDVFRVDYPVDATISENTIIRNEASKAWKGDYHLIASIPLGVVHDQNIGLTKAMSQGDDKYLSKWLNDSDNRAWRTKEGHV